MAQQKKRSRWRACLWLCACAATILALSGCQSVRFYSQAAAGQYEILAHQKLVADLIADPATDPKLKAKLELVNRIRKFAAEELKLPAEKSYLKYVDLHRPYVVWNVNVAPPLSLEPKTWWFPIVGRVSYRGYFSEEAASNYAKIWQKKGWDTFVGDVPTYSTLGWFRDPLLNTFVFEPEAELADTIFHELTHQRLFISGDTDFNEALATMVAGEGVRRWFNAASNSQAYAKFTKDEEQGRDFVKLVMSMRAELRKLYADVRLSEQARLRRKTEIVDDARADYGKLKEKWGVKKSGYDGWFAEPLNNAQINTVAAYYDFVPAFQAVLRADNGDLEKFFADVTALSKLPLAQRHDALNACLVPKQSKL